MLPEASSQFNGYWCRPSFSVTDAADIKPVQTGQSCSEVLYDPVMLYKGWSVQTNLTQLGMAMTSTTASISVVHLHDENFDRLCMFKCVHACHNWKLSMVKCEQLCRSCCVQHAIVLMHHNLGSVVTRQQKHNNMQAAVCWTTVPRESMTHY